MRGILALIPGWLLVLIIIAVVAFILAALHLAQIHFSIGGSVSF